MDKKSNSQDSKPKNLRIITFIIALIIVLIGIYMANQSGDQKRTQVLLETNQGNITIELYSDTMPVTAGNFESLVKKGYYNGIIFHRIIDGFMIQGGDTTGTGMG